MDGSIALPVLFILTIVIGGILVFLFGFGRTQTPASSFESELIVQDEQQKKKKTDKKTINKTLKETKIKSQESIKPKEIVEDKPKVVAQPLKSNPTPQSTPKVDKQQPKKSQQQKQTIAEKPLEVTSMKQSVVQSDVTTSGVWITVEDKKQKKAQKRLQQQQQQQQQKDENETQQQQQQIIKETKESPKLEKKKESTPQPQKQQPKEQETKVDIAKKQTNKPQEEAKLIKPSIPVQPTQPPVEALIKDAADDEWILPSKSNKKKSKKKNEEESTSSSISLVDNLKQTQLGESIILIDNKSTDNNSSSDSVQEVEDGSWAHVKPKAKKVRREK